MRRKLHKQFILHIFQTIRSFIYHAHIIDNKLMGNSKHLFTRQKDLVIKKTWRSFANTLILHGLSHSYIYTTRSAIRRLWPLLPATPSPSASSQGSTPYTENIRWETWKVAWSLALDILRSHSTTVFCKTVEADVLTSEKECNVTESHKWFKNEKNQNKLFVEYTNKVNTTKWRNIV